MLVVGVSILGVGFGVASASTGADLHASSKVPSQASLDNALVTLKDLSSIPGLPTDLGVVTLPAQNPGAPRPCNTPPNRYQPVARAQAKFENAAGLSYLERIYFYPNAKTAARSVADTKAAVNACPSYGGTNAAGGQVQTTQTKAVTRGTYLSWTGTNTSGQDTSLSGYTYIQRKNFLIYVQTFGPTQGGPFNGNTFAADIAAATFDQNKPK
jgi:hypothetical protein